MSLETLKLLTGAEEIIDPRTTRIITRKQGASFAAEVLGESPETEKYYITDDHGRELVNVLAAATGHITCWALVPDESPDKRGGTPFKSFEEAKSLTDKATSTWLFMETLAEAEQRGSWT